MAMTFSKTADLGEAVAVPADKEKKVLSMTAISGELPGVITLAMGRWVSYIRARGVQAHPR